MTEVPKPKRRGRRRWSLSVRGLMLLVLVVGGLTGWEVNRVARVWRAVAFLEANPGVPPETHAPKDFHERHLHNHGDDTVEVFFDDEYSDGFLTDKPRPAWMPRWLRHTLGEDHFRQVTWLDFNRRPTSGDWDAVDALGSIQELSFSGITLRDEDLTRLPNRSGLRVLWLSNTKITDRAMQVVGTLRNLRELHLDGTDVTAEGSASLANLGQLEELTLSGDAGTDLGLFHLRGSKSLRKLDATDATCRVTDRGLGYLEGMTQLESLDFNACDVTDGGIAVLTKLPQLKSLRVGRSTSPPPGSTSLSRAGVEQLGRFPHLETLHLGDSTAVDDSWLESVGRLTSLRKLRLIGEKMTDAGLVHLRGLTILEVLGIACPNVTDAGLKHLRPLSRLRNVGFTARVSGAGIASLRAALPTLRTTSNDPYPDTPVLPPAGPVEAAPAP